MAKRRMQFLVDEKFYQALERLKEKTDSDSLAEVFRDAVKAYDWMVHEISEGREIVSRPYEKEEEKRYDSMAQSVKGG